MLMAVAEAQLIS